MGRTEKGLSEGCELGQHILIPRLVGFRVAGRCEEKVRRVTEGEVGKDDIRNSGNT